MALGEVDGSPVVAAASDDGSARLWDAPVDGRPVVTTASDDRTARL